MKKRIRQQRHKRLAFFHAVNCWPSDNGQGGCDVNIEYELEQTQLELNDVVISIPIPHGVNAPVVSECDGEYQYEKRGSVLQWQLPVIDGSNGSGSMEFSCGGNADDFFPVRVTFYSKKAFSEIKVGFPYFSLFVLMMNRRGPGLLTGPCQVSQLFRKLL